MERPSFDCLCPFISNLLKSGARFQVPAVQTSLSAGQRPYRCLPSGCWVMLARCKNRCSLSSRKLVSATVESALKPIMPINSNGKALPLTSQYSYSEGLGANKIRLRRWIPAWDRWSGCFRFCRARLSLNSSICSRWILCTSVHFSPGGFGHPGPSSFLVGSQFPNIWVPPGTPWSLSISLVWVGTPRPTSDAPTVSWKLLGYDQERNVSPCLKILSQGETIYFRSTCPSGRKSVFVVIRCERSQCH